MAPRTSRSNKHPVKNKTTAFEQSDTITINQDLKHCSRISKRLLTIGAERLCKVSKERGSRICKLLIKWNVIILLIKFFLLERYIADSLLAKEYQLFTPNTLFWKENLCIFDICWTFIYNPPICTLPCNLYNNHLKILHPIKYRKVVILKI